MRISVLVCYGVDLIKPEAYKHDTHNSQSVSVGRVSRYDGGEEGAYDVAEYRKPKAMKNVCMCQCLTNLRFHCSHTRASQRTVQHRRKTRKVQVNSEASRSCCAFCVFQTKVVTVSATTFSNKTNPK